MKAKLFPPQNYTDNMHNPALLKMLVMDLGTRFQSTPSLHLSCQSGNYHQGWNLSHGYAEDNTILFT